MFKMRYLADFPPKITIFKHFQPKIFTFLPKNVGYSRKLSIFAHRNTDHKWIIGFY